MSSKSTALTTKVESGSPYQLSSEQTLKASKALLSVMKASKPAPIPGKKTLLVSTGSDDEEDPNDSPIVWLNLTTKKHIVDAKRLKPTKLALPHPLSSSPTATICLITADPQRTYKDIVACGTFPAALAKRITRVIGIDKIKKKYSQYEAQRQLFAEHDIFLADDRIITLLPQRLGKTFYKNTAKRPIPVSIMAAPVKINGIKQRKTAASQNTRSSPATAPAIAAEIEKALGSALLHLSPTASTAIRVGNASMTPEQLAENIESVVTQTVEKVVPQKWKGVKSIHVKGNQTIALPIWLAEELWTDERDVLDRESAEKVKEANIGKKRKAKVIEGPAAVETKGGKKQKLLESNDDKLDQEIADRKERLRRQKADAEGDVEDEVPKPSKKGRKAKTVA